MANAQNADVGCIGVNIAKLNRKKTATTKRAKQPPMEGEKRAARANKKARLAKVSKRDGKAKGKICRPDQTHSPKTPNGMPNAKPKPSNTVQARATRVGKENRCNFSPPSLRCNFRSRSPFATCHSLFATRRGKGCAPERGQTVFGRR